MTVPSSQTVLRHLLVQSLKIDQIKILSQEREIFTDVRCLQ